MYHGTPSSICNFIFVEVFFFSYCRQTWSLAYMNICVHCFLFSSMWMVVFLVASSTAFFNRLLSVKHGSPKNPFHLPSSHIHRTWPHNFSLYNLMYVDNIFRIAWYYLWRQISFPFVAVDITLPKFFSSNLSSCSQFLLTEFTSYSHMWQCI